MTEMNRKIAEMLGYKIVESDLADVHQHYQHKDGRYSYLKRYSSDVNLAAKLIEQLDTKGSLSITHHRYGAYSEWIITKPDGSWVSRSATLARAMCEAFIKLESNK